MDIGVRGIAGPDILVIHRRVNREEKAGPEGMGRAHQIAQIAALADPLDPDPELATHPETPPVRFFSLLGQRTV
jgi:hypothetical protein